MTHTHIYIVIKEETNAPTINQKNGFPRRVDKGIFVGSCHVDALETIHSPLAIDIRSPIYIYPKLSNGNDPSAWISGTDAAHRNIGRRKLGNGAQNAKCESRDVINRSTIKGIIYTSICVLLCLLRSI